MQQLDKCAELTKYKTWTFLLIFSCFLQLLQYKIINSSEESVHMQKMHSFSSDQGYSKKEGIFCPIPNLCANEFTLSSLRPAHLELPVDM